MVYEGKRNYTRRRGSGRRRGKKSSAVPALLVAAIWVLFLAAAVRILLPDVGDKLGEAAEALGISGVYRTVTGVMSDAIDKGKSVFTAVYDACVRAFKPESSDVPVDSGDVGDFSDNEHSSDVPVSDTGGDASVFWEDPSGGGNDVVSDFKASQAAFADRELPSHVTYEKPELTIECVAPADGSVTSGFGYRAHPSDGVVRFHYGVDIAAAEGSEVCCAAAGEVEAIGESTSYGKYVIVSHEGGVETLYAHLSEVTVSGGEQLEAGSKIGLMGSTGNATASCLHFEMLINGDYVNPLYYLEP